MFSADLAPLESKLAQELAALNAQDIQLVRDFLAKLKAGRLEELRKEISS